MLPSLLLLVVLRNSPVMQPPATACQDVRRVELSLARGATEEICVSPGLLTGFVFDSRIVMELEDEVRFEVTRGNTSFSLRPPGDAVAGEDFRLTAHFMDGASVTFVLRVHKGRATRQVEVYRDKRTRESYQHEVAQEQAKVLQLQQENESLRLQLRQLRAELGTPNELRPLIASGTLGKTGIRVLELGQKVAGHEEGPLTVTLGISYRSNSRIAVAIWLLNNSDEAWSAIEATLVDAKGKELKGVQFWLKGGFIPPHEVRMLVVETDAMHHAVAQAAVTLILREAGPRGLTLPKVAFP